MLSIRTVAQLLLIALFAAAPARVTEPVHSGDVASRYQQLLAEAERHFAEGSYAAANRLYEEADRLELPGEQRRWVDFRLADTRWRSKAATETADPTTAEQARQTLEQLIRDARRPEDRDRVWAEAEESLGDFWWMRRHSRNWSQAWVHYRQALDWWAGAVDIELARERYLSMVWTMARPSQVEPYYVYGAYGNFLPLDVAESALRIARTEDERAHGHYLVAMTLRSSVGNWEQRQRVPAEFEAALDTGRTEWYDDALFHYAEWMHGRGNAVLREDGQWAEEQDYVKALELFRRLTREYAKGETRYFDQARQYIKTITEPTVGVSVSSVFLPGSEIEYYLSWRNVAKIELALYPVVLPRDVSFAGSDSSAGAWLSQIDTSGRDPVDAWIHRTDDDGRHRPGREAVQLDRTLPLGAYLLEVRDAGVEARELILVTDAAVVLKSAASQSLVYVCDALDGSPLANASVSLWNRQYNGKRWIWDQQNATADAQGLAAFDLTLEPDNRHRRELFVSAMADGRQAFAMASSYYGRSAERPWRIYAFTDRPAYRPGETVQWKFVARRHDGDVYLTPADEIVVYEVTDPRGGKVAEGEVRLNSFGSAWDSLEVEESMPLGEFRVQFWNRGRGQSIGSATLFRLEEYKLPEFRVSIGTPTEGGRKKTFRLGQSVEVQIEAEYYFGGPVDGATVELLVYQRPFYHWWWPKREFPWFYGDMRPSAGYYGGESLVERRTLQSDAAGRAVLTFETPAGQQQDLEYRIEARVTDASRREILASDTVRVTRQSYYVHPRPRHNLYRPQDEVAFDIKAVDANDAPVEVEGAVTVTRDYWFEIWLDPDGNEFEGDALKRIREQMDVFPPPPRFPGDRGWRLKFRGYQHDEILRRTLRTDAAGEAELRFVPEREGFYRMSWSGRVKQGAPVAAEATVWVATTKSSELGYRYGGLQIIVDRDTFRAGQTAPVMLSAPTNDRYVLFSVEGEDLHSYRLVHLEGNVKLLEVELTERHVPNIHLGAAMVSDAALFIDTQQVVVPPVQNFLEVELSFDREQYRPREKGVLALLTKDHDGRPVSAEVSLGLVDEAVYYIQRDYAGDPRQFFFGAKRPLRVRTSSSFQQRRYARLAEGEEISIGGVVLEQARDEFEGDESSLMSRSAPAKRRARMDVAEEAAGFAQLEKAEPAPAEAPTAMAEGPAVQVRSDFRSTVLWRPDVATGDDGRAELEVTFPDSLTGWLATARVAAHNNRFGITTASTRTQQPLIVRLQAPRFFVVGDEATVSAVIHNNTEASLAVTPGLEAEGVRLVAGPGRRDPLTVPAGGERRVDWKVSATRAGRARLEVEARGEHHADAMRKEYPIHEHGIEKLIARSGKLRGDEVEVRVDLPAERRPGSTRLTVQVAPSLAVTMLDALPYLIDYPYGCTEQTMSRFLPAVITARTLKDLGLRPESMKGRLFGGVEPEHAQRTHPDGRGDLDQLDEMVEQGLRRLYDFQHADGGWGWWKQGESDHFMTAYVVWGLTLARSAGVSVKGKVVERAVGFLEAELVEAENRHDLQAWMLHALAAHHAAAGRGATPPYQAAALENLWTHRDGLNAYSRALLALCAHHYGERQWAATLVRNLENGVKIDRSPDTSVVQRGGAASHAAVVPTAHWGADGLYRRWSDGGVEATAFALRALLTIDPQNELVEPVSYWLIRNRRGAQWSNTRDTAIAVLTLNDYLRVSGEAREEVAYELSVNGRSVVRKRLGPEDMLAAPSRFTIDPAWILDGSNRIRITRTAGSGPLYFAAEARFFSLEEPVTPAGNEIFVRRQYYRMVPRPTLLKGHVYDRRPLDDGDTLISGERVEAVITIESKNQLEYMVFEDLKPAGLEAVRIRSGEPLFARELRSDAVEERFAAGDSAAVVTESEVAPTGDHTARSRRVYQELRDRKVALFLDRLPEGVWEIRYDLRAEVPGRFHALPVTGHAMYVPEIRGNGAESRLTVRDAGEQQ
jgi:uncharacterized protein YfaS (alpha-2-macroglobulin family)